MRRLRGSDRRVEIALALVVLSATACLVQPNGAQAASRLALTAAVAEQGTVRIDEYEGTLGADYAEKDGHLYSDKAPGQPLAAVPLWAAYRSVGGDEGTNLRVREHFGLWWVTLWSATVPAALLVVAMFRYGRRLTDPVTAALCALAMGLGTLVFPFATLLFGHTLSALLAFVSFLLIRKADEREPAGQRRMLGAAGLAIGTAVAVEYTVAIVGVVLLVAVLRSFTMKTGWFLAGGLLPGVILAAYHWVAFGGPLEHPYKYSVFDLHHDTFAGIGAPDVDVFVSTLLGDRGLLTLTPVVGIAVAGLVTARARVRWLDVAVPLGVVGLYLLFAAGWIDPTGGYSPGPRHLLPALPLLVGGLAMAAARWPRLTLVAAVYSTATMALATLGDPQLPTNARPALRLWVERFAGGDGPSTVFSAVVGDAGLLVVAVLTLLAVLHLRRELATASTDQARRLVSPSHGAEGTSGPGSHSGGASNR